MLVIAPVFRLWIALHKNLLGMYWSCSSSKLIIHRDNNSNARILDHTWLTVGLHTVNSRITLLNINVNCKPSGTQTGGNTGRDYSLLSLPLPLGSFFYTNQSCLAHYLLWWHSPHDFRYDHKATFFYWITPCRMPTFSISEKNFVIHIGIMLALLNYSIQLNLTFLQRKYGN